MTNSTLPTTNETWSFYGTSGDVISKTLPTILKSIQTGRTLDLRSNCSKRVTIK